eukprot:1835714-Amphidinium_carterae.1
MRLIGATPTENSKLLYNSASLSILGKPIEDHSPWFCSSDDVFPESSTTRCSHATSTSRNDSWKLRQSTNRL